MWGYSRVTRIFPRETNDVTTPRSRKHGSRMRRGTGFRGIAADPGYIRIRRANGIPAGQVRVGRRLRTERVREAGLIRL